MQTSRWPSPFLDDCGFLLADGYGTFKIHRYDKDAMWVSCFGGAGKGEGTFNTPHGIWIDRRPAADGSSREPTIVICDRAHHTLQAFAMDGTYKETVTGFGLPANLDTWQNLMVVPELKACVTLLDEVKNLRALPDQWKDGEFVHPHDACFTPSGDIFVAELVATGRITKLERV